MIVTGVPVPGFAPDLVHPVNAARCLDAGKPGGNDPPSFAAIREI